MQRIREFIKTQARHYEAAPLLRFLRDSSIDPRQRLSWVPCIAHWIMGFSELNSIVLRDDSSQDAIQQMINAHSHEDDDHWLMYLKDVETLGLNDAMDFTSAVKQLWGKETQRSRELLYYLMGTSTSASPAMRMVLVEAVEEASRISFAAAFEAAEAFEKLAGKPLYFFGTAHMELESDHTMRTDDAEKMLDAIQLSEGQFEEAKRMVEKIFKLFDAMFDEVLVYARQHPAPVQGPALQAGAK